MQHGVCKKASVFACILVKFRIFNKAVCSGNYLAKTILNLPFTEPIRCRTFALCHGVIKRRRHCEKRSDEAIQRCVD